MRILKIEAGKAPYEKEVDNTLQALQQEVEGYIECISFPSGAILVCNEEGKVDGMTPNRRLESDIICGPFFLCGCDEEGDFTSLSPEDMATFKTLFAEVPTFTGKEPELTPKASFYTFDAMGGMG